MPRTRVIHIHGISQRDHSSLAHLAPEKLDPVIELLLRENYPGVLTLEVFGEDDFYSSATMFEKTLKETHHKGTKTQGDTKKMDPS